MAERTEEGLPEIFTPAEKAEVLLTFERTLHAGLKKGERFQIGGTLREERLEVSVELADAERHEVATFFAGMELDSKEGLGAIDARANAVEFLHVMIQEYLQSERFPRPHLDWREYVYEGNPIFYRGSVLDEVLEAAADALLGDSFEEM